MNPGLKAAIDAAGGFRPLARALGIDHRAVMGWDKIPATRLLTIEEIFRVPRHELRPDLFNGYVIQTKINRGRSRLPQSSKRKRSIGAI